MVKTANDKLRDAAFKHAHLIAQYKNAEARRVISFLNQKVLPDALAKIEAKLKRIEDRGPTVSVESTKALAEMVKAYEAIIAEGMRTLSMTSKKELTKFATHEAKWQSKALQSALPDSSGVTIDLPDPGLLRAIVTTRPLQGTKLEDWYGALGASAQKRIKSELNIGLAQGESVPDLVKRLRGTRENNYSDGAFQTTRREAETVAITAAGAVAGHARAAVAKENEDILQGELWDSTLDHRTCLECAGLDGTLFAIGEGPLAHDIHPRCRCERIPQLKSADELGIEESDLPEGERAALGGAVARSTTYDEWLADQDANTQDAILGPARAELFRTGQINISEFTNDAGRTLTLSQLSAQEGIDFDVPEPMTVEEVVVPPTPPQTVLETLPPEEDVPFIPPTRVAAIEPLNFLSTPESERAPDGKTWIAGLSVAQRKATRGWTLSSTEFRIADGGSTHGVTEEAIAFSKTDSVKQQLADFKQALAKAPVSKADEIYRGMAGFDKGQVQAMFEVGGKVQIEGLSSFSETRSVADDFSRKSGDGADGSDSVAMTVVKTLKSADRPLGVRLTPTDADLEDEAEVVVPKGMKLHVISVKKTGALNAIGGDHYEVTLAPFDGDEVAPASIAPAPIAAPLPTILSAQQVKEIQRAFIGPGFIEPPEETRKESADRWAKSLTDEQTHVLKSWIRTGYTDMRRVDKGLVPEGPAEFQEQMAKSARKQLDILKEALKNAPLVDKAEIYRGLGNLDVGFAEKNFVVGEVVQIDAISSFTTKAEVAGNFANAYNQDSVVMTVETKGKKIAVDISGGEHPVLNQSESEIVVPKGVKLRVTSVTRGREHGKGGARYAVTLEPIDLTEEERAAARKTPELEELKAKQVDLPARVVLDAPPNMILKAKLAEKGIEYIVFPGKMTEADKTFVYKLLNYGL